MGLALGWMAIALAGLAGTPQTERTNGPIRYTVRFVEADGLGWREGVFTRLTPVSRQGAATIWTAPRAVMPKLLESATKDSGSNGWMSPIMSARPGAPVHFAIRKNQQLVTQVAWNGDDRPEMAKSETVRTGPVGTMTGRQIDQGVLVQLVLEDTEVRAVHRVTLAGAEAHNCQATPSAAAMVKPQAFIGQGKAAGLTAYAYQIQDSQAGGCCSSATCGTETKAVKTGAEQSVDRVLVLSLPPLIESPMPCETHPHGTISEIRIKGSATIPVEIIKAKLLSKTGQPIDMHKIDADIKSLMHAKWFSDVQVYYAPFQDGRRSLYFEVHEKPAPTHADPATETCPNAPAAVNSTASTDCASQKDEVIQAHLERISPASAVCTSSTSSVACVKGDETRAVAIEVPEIDSQEIMGEWLVPKDGILLVSFGPHTVADKDGKAVVRERLAIVEAEGITDGAVQRTSRVPGFVPSPRSVLPPATAAPRTIPAPVVAPKVPIAVPVPPSRSIPQGAHPDGTPAELPPLPADEIETPHPSQSAEPSPSPQIKKTQPPANPESDSQAKKTGYQTTPTSTAIPGMFLATPNVGLQFLVPFKPISFQLPFNRRLEIEILGRVVPNPEPIDNHKTDE